MVPARNQYCCMLIHNRILTDFINLVCRIILNNNYTNPKIIKLMTQKYCYAFDSPNDLKFRPKSLNLILNLSTLGWNITPVQQCSANC